MSFVVRNADTIREEMLADFRSRMRAKGVDVDTAEGSEIYNEFDAIALQLEANELAAREASARVLVRSSYGDDLIAFAEDLGTSKIPASKARRHVLVSGTVSTVFTLTSGVSMNSIAGARFFPIDPDTGLALASVETNGSGNAEIIVEAELAGTEGNLATDGTAVLTWSTAPSGMASIGYVSTGALTIEGEAEETESALQERLLEILREHPAAGNRADWRQKGLRLAGVSEVYVYPLVKPPASTPAAGTPDVSGCTTVVLMGPPQGRSTSNTRLIGGTGGARLPQHKDYFLGVRNEKGVLRPAVTSDETEFRWIPAQLHPDDFECEAVRVQTVNITVQLEVDEAAPFTWSWTGGPLTSSLASTTSITVSGDHRAKIGLNMLVFVGTTHERGGWKLVKITDVAFSAGNTRLAFDTLTSAPDAGRDVYPAPSNWTQLQDAVFAHFDALGPTGFPAYPQCARFPPESWKGRSTLYLRRLEGDLMRTAGVLTAAITSPGGNVTPTPPKTLVCLGEFLPLEA